MVVNILVWSMLKSPTLLAAGGAPDVRAQCRLAGRARPADVDVTRTGAKTMMTEQQLAGHLKAKSGGLATASDGNLPTVIACPRRHCPASRLRKRSGNASHTAETSACVWM